MKNTIVYRTATDKERCMLEEETRSSPHIGFIRREVWKSFGKVFVLENKTKLIGVCVAVQLRHWYKLGPIIVLAKYQGQGFGKQLLSHAVSSLQKTNLYIGTPNPRFVSIVGHLQFVQSNWWHLPLEIKRYFLAYLFKRFGWEYSIDAIRKKFTSHRWRYTYFVHLRQ